MFERVFFRTCEIVICIIKCANNTCVVEACAPTMGQIIFHHFRVFRPRCWTQIRNIPIFRLVTRGSHKKWNNHRKLSSQMAFNKCAQFSHKCAPHMCNVCRWFSAWLGKRYTVLYSPCVFPSLRVCVRWCVFMFARTCFVSEHHTRLYHFSKTCAFGNALQSFEGCDIHNIHYNNGL